MGKKEAKILLAALIVLLGIGYAVIRSGLNINGTTHVMNNTWDVHFENYQASSGSVTPTTEPSTTGNPTSVSYEVTLTNPGDYYEFTIDAVNSGTMDVMIESFSSKIGNTEITPSTLPPYLSYSATYSDGVELQNKQELLHNTRETLKLKIAYRDDIPTTDLPSTVQDLSLSFTITYVQDDGTSIPVKHHIALNKGDYFMMVPDADTYTISGSQTGYINPTPYTQQISEGSASYWNSYYCCQNTMPTLDSETGNYSSSGAYYQSVTSISGKYCSSYGSDSATPGNGCSFVTDRVRKPLNKPSSTSYTPSIFYTSQPNQTFTDQTIDPSELNLWRVININGDGSIDAISEYTSSTNIYFQGITGYANFIEGLQKISESYAKSGYTIGTRIMGYNGQTKTISDISSFDGSSSTAPSTTTTPTSTIGVGEEYSDGVLGDTLYLRDYEFVSNIYADDIENYGNTGLKAYKVGTTTASSYWLSSRQYEYSKKYSNAAATFSFEGLFVSTAGNLDKETIRYYYGIGNSWEDSGKNRRALRPIITLKPGIYALEGNGTKDDPYTLNN